MTAPAAWVKTLRRTGLPIAVLGAATGADTTELQPAEMELIKLLEMLEALDFLQEDSDIIRNLIPAGEEHGGCPLHHRTSRP